MGLAVVKEREKKKGKKTRRFNIPIKVHRHTSCENMIGIHAYVTHCVYCYIICGMCSQQHAVLATVERRSRSSWRDNDLSWLAVFNFYRTMISRIVRNDNMSVRATMTRVIVSKQWLWKMIKKRKKKRTTRYERYSVDFSRNAFNRARNKYKNSFSDYSKNRFLSFESHSRNLREIQALCTWNFYS